MSDFSVCRLRTGTTCITSVLAFLICRVRAVQVNCDTIKTQAYAGSALYPSTPGTDPGFCRGVAQNVVFVDKVRVGGGGVSPPT